MKPSSTISHRSRNPSGWLKALISICFLLLGIGTPAAIAEDLDFFPLQIGNIWTYADFNSTLTAYGEPSGAPPDTFTVAVVDTQRIGGVLYYQFDDGMMRLIGFQKLYRKDADGNIYVYDSYLRRECLRFLASSSLIQSSGDMWYDQCLLSPPYQDYWNGFPRRLSGTLPGGAISVGEAWGIFLITNWIELWLVDGFGIVWQNKELSSPVVLTEAVINGQHIPRTTETLLMPTSWGTIKKSTLQRENHARRER